MLQQGSHFHKDALPRETCLVLKQGCHIYKDFLDDKNMPCAELRQLCQERRFDEISCLVPNQGSCNDEDTLTMKDAKQWRDHGLAKGKE
jgi:hypothetical protein